MIRPKFAAKLKSLKKRQEGLGYKPMWVYFQILESFPDIAYEEVQAVGEALGYKPGWAKYKWAEIEESRSQQSSQGAKTHTRQQGKGRQRQHNRQSLESEFEEWLRAWGYGTYTSTSETTNTNPLYLAPPFLRPHLQILGLHWPTTLAEVKAAYRQLAKRFHPDAGGDAEKFIEVGESYNVVSGYLK